jgi:hypothetical protein
MMPENTRSTFSGFCCIFVLKGVSLKYVLIVHSQGGEKDGSKEDNLHHKPGGRELAECATDIPAY